MHTHSLYCDGKDSLEDMVLKAIELNFHTIGFSGHGYVPFCDFGMNEEKLTNYLNELDYLKVKYQDQINILKSVEVDNVTVDYNPNLFDYVLYDSHGFFKNNHYICVDGTLDPLLKAIKEDYDNNPYALVEEYYDTYYNFVSSHKSLFLPHYDIVCKLNKNNIMFDENSNEYLNLAFKHLKDLRKLDIPMEMNSGAIARGYKDVPYPSVPILKEWLKLGGEIVLASDCHNKDYLDCYFDDGLKLLKDVGYEYVVEYEGLKKNYIKL